MEYITQNKNLQKIILAIGGILFAIGLGFLIKKTNDDYNKQIDNINKRMASKMSTCWEEVEKTGGTCHLEYIYENDGQTPVSARVIKK